MLRDLIRDGRDHARKSCAVDECGRPHYRKGLCSAHWTRQHRHGHPLGGGPFRDVRGFWEKVNKTEGCWEWLGARTGSGYGVFRRQPAHRLAWIEAHGPIPDGLQIDHLCRNRRCVNPDHLEPVTVRENLLRSPISWAGINARKDICNHGHALAGDNLYRDPRGRRRCRACMWASDKRRRAAR
jgi:hypothetical protein